MFFIVFIFDNPFAFKWILSNFRQSWQKKEGGAETEGPPCTNSINEFIYIKFQNTRQNEGRRLAFIVLGSWAVKPIFQHDIVLGSRAVKPIFLTRLVNPNLPQILKLNLFVEGLATSHVVGGLLASQAEQLRLVAAVTRHHVVLTSRGQPLLGRRDRLESWLNRPVAMVWRIPLLRLPLPAGGDYRCPPHPIPT